MYLRQVPKSAMDPISRNNATWIANEICTEWVSVFLESSCAFSKRTPFVIRTIELIFRWASPANGRTQATVSSHATPGWSKLWPAR